MTICISRFSKSSAITANSWSRVSPKLRIFVWILSQGLLLFDNASFRLRIVVKLSSQRNCFESTPYDQVIADSFVASWYPIPRRKWNRKYKARLTNWWRTIVLHLGFYMSLHNFGKPPNHSRFLAISCQYCSLFTILSCRR